MGNTLKRIVTCDKYNFLENKFLTKKIDEIQFRIIIEKQNMDKFIYV